MRAIRGFARSDSGAAAIEFAIVVWVLILVCLGIIELGRGLHVRNEMSYGADLAARMMLTFPQYSGEVLHPDCEERLRTKVREAFTGPRPGDLTVDFSIDEANTFRSVLIRYPFTLLIPGFGDTFDLTVTRSVPTGDSGPCPAAS